MNIHSFRKHFNRSAQTIKRNIVTSSKRTDPDYDLLVQTLNNQIKALRRMNLHVIQYANLCMAQVDKLKILAQDLASVYHDPTTTTTTTMMTASSSSGRKKKKSNKDDNGSDSDNEHGYGHDDEIDFSMQHQQQQQPLQPRNELPLVASLLKIAQQHEAEIVRPLMDQCTDIQSQIKSYLSEVKDMSRGASLKIRHRRLLDYELYESRWNSVSAKPRNTSKEMALYDDTREAYMTARDAFEDADHEAKTEMRSVILNRYQTLYPTLVNLFSQVMAQYYELLARTATALRNVEQCEAPEPLMHERQRDQDGGFIIGGSVMVDHAPRPQQSSPIVSPAPAPAPAVLQATQSRPPQAQAQAQQNTLPYPLVETPQVTSRLPPIPPPKKHSLLGQRTELAAAVPSVAATAGTDSSSSSSSSDSGAETGGAATTVTTTTTTTVATVKFHNPMIPDHLSDVEWYYKNSPDGEEVGPVKFSELRQLKQEGTIGEKTLVMGNGSSEWIPVQEEPELVMYLL